MHPITAAVTPHLCSLSSLRDPVASFHLKNGALSHHVHWMADGSERGMRQSMGVMATYVYR